MRRRPTYAMTTGARSSVPAKGSKQSTKPLGPKAMRRRLSTLPPLPSPRPPNKRYTIAEEDVLVSRSLLGDRAAGNMILIAFDDSIQRCAKHWYFSIRGHNLDLDDVIQACRMGAMHSLEKYKRSAGSLEKYLLIWAMQHAVRAIQNDGFPIRVPVHQHQALSKHERAQTEIDQPIPSKLLGVAMAKRLARLDEPMRGENSRHVARRDTMPTHWPNAEEKVAADERVRVVREVVGEVRGGMTPLDKAILDHRILTDDPLDLAEIGRNNNRSRERARQRHAVVMHQLTVKIRQRLALSDVA